MASASAESVLRNYLHAKDENRPHLLEQVFAPDAELEVLNHTSAIAFPARTLGRDAIAEVLVRRFGQTYENVYSFYLQRPAPLAATFSCSWLVAMSDKDSGELRVGCGRYDWVFADEEPRLATHLTITIRAMQILPPTTLPAVLAWLGRLSYPWSSITEVRRFAPGLERLDPVLQDLASHEGSPEDSPVAPLMHTSAGR